MSRAAVLLSLFLTGAAGLAGEVVWARLLASQIGSSHRAMAAAVLATLAGWALGSYLGGRLADRSSAPLRLFGLLAVLAGVASLAVPYLIRAADPCLAWVYRLHDGQSSHPLFAASEVLVCMAILVLPGAFLGAMFPALARHLTTELGEAGAWTGSLSGLQALGAALGAWSAGFVLIPWQGLLRTSVVASAAEAAVGLWVLRPWKKSGAAAAPARVPAPSGSPSPLPRTRWILTAIAVSGMANVMLELGWTRAVLLALGNSSLAFSAVLGLFALGTFVGSIAAVPFADRVRSPQAALGWAMAGTGLIAAVTIPALGVFPLEFAHWLSQKRLPMSYPLFLLLGFTWTSALVFPATVLMGMSVPFACRLTILITRGETADAAGAPARVGRGVGSALAASTAGSLAGAGLVGFVLYRLFGNLWLPLYLATGLVIVAALALMLLDRFAPRRLPLRVAGAAGILTAYAALAVLHRPYGIFDKPESRQRYWNPTTLSLGPLLNYQNAGRAETVADLERNYADAYETLYYRDGENGSVGVFGMKGADPKTLRINGEAEASSGTGSMDMPVQVLAGHLAMLARPGARTALNLGFGSGVSAGCMSLYPDLERLTCLEVSPEVLEGARSFADVNHGALTNPKVVAIAGDGRSHLRHTAALYDVISCQPSNFWIAGQGDLFTREFYRSIASRLTPDGVACQSLIASRMRLQDFRLAVLTFRLVFPGTSLWCVGRHALLLGSMRSIEWSRDWIERCLSEPAIRADLSTLGIDRPEALFRYLRFEHQAILTFAGDGPDNRDFHPRLEYSAPFGLFDGTNELQLLLASAGRLDLQDQAASFAGFEPAARTLIETYRTRGALLQKVDAQLSSWSVSAGMDLLIKIRKEEDAWLWAAAGQLVGRWSMTRSEDQGRLLLLRALLVLDAPALRQAYRALDRGKVDASLLKQAGRGASEGDWTAHLLLAQQALDLDDAQGALDLAKEARRRGAPLRRVAAIQGSAYGLQGDLAAAERSFQEALAAAGKGERGEILYNLGYAREKGKDYLGAIEYQRMAMAEGANPVLSGVALARSLRAAGRPQEAFRAAEEASRKKESAEAFFEAAQALLDQGMHAEAARWMAQAVEADPESYSKDLEALESRGK